MKTTQLAPFALLLMLFAFACQKETSTDNGGNASNPPPPAGIGLITGEYEWIGTAQTQVPSGGMPGNTATGWLRPGTASGSHRFGVRIKSNGNALFFKDGQPLFNTWVNQIVQNADSSITFQSPYNFTTDPYNTNPFGCKITGNVLVANFGPYPFFGGGCYLCSWRNHFQLKTTTPGTDDNSFTHTDPNCTANDIYYGTYTGYRADFPGGDTSAYDQVTYTATPGNLLGCTVNVLDQNGTSLGELPSLGYARRLYVRNDTLFVEKYAGFPPTSVPNIMVSQFIGKKN